MSALALVVVVIGSAAATISGLIAAAIRNWRNRSGNKSAAERYRVTVEKDGKAYRIESDSPQAAENAIKGIIEHPQN